MTMKVFVTRRLPADVHRRLADHAQVDVWERPTPPSPEKLAERTRPCHGLLSMPTETVGASLLDQAPSLRVVSNMAVGYDNVDVAACTERGIVVGHTPGVLTETTADLTWTLILAASRRLREGIDAVGRGEWPSFPSGMLGRDVHGAILGIVGFGAIGRAVARRAEAFGMEVIHHSRQSGLALDEVLSRADIISLHCPLTDETRGLIGPPELALMKPTAILVNTARGPIVDHQALTKALSSRRLFAAGLDVTFVEPLPPDDPILSLPNCIVLPHIGSATIETRFRMATLAVDNLIAGLRGDTLPHSVNPKGVER
jgi:lactate dehydrogenase-like 2-hydroxyacid dehydrogenase